MRRLIALPFALLWMSSAIAATLKVEVVRNGFAGPVQVAVAPRADGATPDWMATKTVAPDESIAAFEGLREGLYTVLASGADPMQRLSAKANVGAEGSALRFIVPKSALSMRVTTAGEPIPRSKVAFTHEELRWVMEVELDDAGFFEGPLWEPGLYTAQIWRDPTAAPHITEVTLSPVAMVIAVPDRHITGRVLGDDGRPVGGAHVHLRSESGKTTLSLRTRSAPDGRFAFFGVRQGGHSVTARAPAYLDSDTAAFELRTEQEQAIDLQLTRGKPRTVRVVDSRGGGVAEASLFTTCDGYLKSTATTGAEGRAEIAMPHSSGCLVFAFPSGGSIAMGRPVGAEALEIRVPPGSSSLRLALKSEAGQAFADLWLLMRVNGAVVPPAIARQLSTRGLTLMTDSEGSVSLANIPPGTYEFWPYRTEAEGRMLFDVAGDIEAPITLNVVTGENHATVRFKAR